MGAVGGELGDSMMLLHRTLGPATLVWSQLRAPKSVGIGECLSQRGRTGDAPACPSLSLLIGAILQGEWDLQPLPQIVSKLEVTEPQCSLARASHSPANPILVDLKRGSD